MTSQVRSVKLGVPPEPPPDASPYERELFEWLAGAMQEIETVSVEQAAAINEG